MEPVNGFEPLTY